LNAKHGKTKKDKQNKTSNTTSGRRRIGGRAYGLIHGASGHNLHSGTGESEGLSTTARVAVSKGRAFETERKTGGALSMARG